jgi:hypothetical protein
MARQPRVEYTGALDHFIARGNEQHTICHDETNRQHFLTVFGHEILQMSPARQGKSPVYKWCRIFVREVGVTSAGERRRRPGHKPDG